MKKRKSKKKIYKFRFNNCYLNYYDYYFNLPINISESIDKLILFLQVHFHFLSHIKNGTILAMKKIKNKLHMINTKFFFFWLLKKSLLGANNIFMQVSLASLTLRPQTRELGLERGYGADLFLKELGFLVLAVAAYGAVQLIVVQNCLAAQASLLLLGEHGQAANLRNRHRLGQSMITLLN